jgi:hypothetical protein
MNYFDDWVKNKVNETGVPLRQIPAPGVAPPDPGATPPYPEGGRRGPTQYPAPQPAPDPVLQEVIADLQRVDQKLNRVFQQSFQTKGRLDPAFIPQYRQIRRELLQLSQSIQQQMSIRAVNQLR